MAVDDEDSDVPETGAVFTFGKCKFNDNFPGKFWLRDDRVVCVSCGDEHTAIVSESGKLFTFGDNMWGQLGLGHCKAVKKPTRVKALLEEKVVMVACGRSHTLVTTASGNLYTFGANDEGQLGFDSNGQERVPVPSKITLPPKAGRIKQIAAGVYHSACLNETGDMYVWGQGSEGQLGLGMDVAKQSTPAAVPFDDNISHIACGYYHTVVVTKSGSLYSCGEMDNGKLGCPSDADIDHYSLQRVKIPDKVTAVSCGHNHTVTLTAKGDVFTFGDGANGQLGHGNKLLESPTPNLIQWNKPTKIVHVACGEGHTALISDRGILYTCGDGLHGKLALGDDNLSNHFKPTPVSRFAPFLVESVSCGGCHTLVIARPRPEGDDDGDSLEEPSISDSVDESLTHGKLSIVGEMIRRGELSNSLDMSGSIAARMRRRQKAPELLSTQSLALPRLKTEQNSPQMTSKHEHKGEKLDNDADKREKLRRSDSDASESEESALSKTMTMPAPLPRPRHVSRFIKRTDADVEKQPIPVARHKLPPPTNKEPVPGPADHHRPQDSADSLESGIDESESDNERKPVNGDGNKTETHEVKASALQNLKMADESSADEVSEEEVKQEKVEKLNKEKEKAETSDKKTPKRRLRFLSQKKSDKVTELSDNEADGDKHRTDKDEKKKEKEKDSEDEEEMDSEEDNKKKINVSRQNEKDVKEDEKKKKESENELEDDDVDEHEKDKKKKKKDKADKVKIKDDVSEPENDVESETDESRKKKEKDEKKKSGKNKNGKEKDVESNGEEVSGDEDGTKKKKKDKMKKVKTEVEEEDDEDGEKKGGKHGGKKKKNLKDSKDSKKKKDKGDAEEEEEEESKKKGKDKKKKNSSKKKSGKASADEDSGGEEESLEDESASKSSLPNDKKASNKKKVSDKKTEEKDGKKEESKADDKSKEKSEDSKKEEEKSKESEKKNSKFCAIL